MTKSSQFWSGAGSQFEGKSLCTQGLILGAVLFNICINDPADGTKSTLNKVTGDTDGEVACTDVLQFRGTCTGWRTGLTGISGSSTTGNAVLHLRKNNPDISRCFPVVWPQQPVLKGPGGPSGQQPAHEPATCSGDTESLLGYMRILPAGRWSFPSAQHWGSHYGVLCPVLGNQVQGRYRLTGISWVQGHEED